MIATKEPPTTQENPETTLHGQSTQQTRPRIPEIYRALSLLIQDTHHFFHSLVQIDEDILHTRLIASDHTDPIISLTDTSNPLPRTDDHPNPLPSLLDAKINGNNEPATTESFQKLLTFHFESALLHKTKKIFTQDHQFDHWDPAQWDEPTRAEDLLTAGKCLFLASNLADNIQTHIEGLEQEFLQSVEGILDETITLFLVDQDPTREVHDHWTSESDPSDITLNHSGITLNKYNKAAILLGCTPQTYEANRGAVPWILAQPITSPTPDHQGKFIGAERALAITYAMTPKAWTRMTAFDPALTYMIIRTCRDMTQSAAIINWLSSFNHPININNLRDLLRRSDVSESLAKPPQTLTDENTRKVVSLAIQHTPQDPQGYAQERTTTHDISDAHIYIHQMAHNRTKVTATTWKGLLKAIHRWHEQADQIKTQMEWDKIIAANNNQVRTWEPIVRHFEYGAVTATELTDEAMLLQEALEMKHCVHLYGKRASTGQTHIFSLRDESGNRATLSIIPTQGGWREEQTRGYKNHPTTQPIRDCAQELVQTCKVHN